MKKRQKVIERQAHRKDCLKLKQKNQNQATKKSPYKKPKPNEPQQTTTALHSFPKVALETRAVTKVSEINFIG